MFSQRSVPRWPLSICSVKCASLQRPWLATHCGVCSSHHYLHSTCPIWVSPESKHQNDKAVPTCSELVHAWLTTGIISLYLAISNHLIPVRWFNPCNIWHTTPEEPQGPAGLRIQLHTYSPSCSGTSSPRHPRSARLCSGQRGPGWTCLGRGREVFKKHICPLSHLHPTEHVTEYGWVNETRSVVSSSLGPHGL